MHNVLKNSKTLWNGCVRFRLIIWFTYVQYCNRTHNNRLIKPAGGYIRTYVDTNCTYIHTYENEQAFIHKQCSALIQRIGRWTPSRGFFPRGFDPRTRTEKYLWDGGLCLPPTRRRSEVGGAEPEIWRSPNQKRSRKANAKKERKNDNLQTQLHVLWRTDRHTVPE